MSQAKSQAKSSASRRNALDGGEAILQAFRALDIDYVITSPGSEWGSLWEAFARQDANGAKGPKWLSCGHETLAVDLAIGYTRYTGRMQAVVLHAGVGLLQGAMGVDTAYRQNVPMIVLSGESLSYGEQDGFDPGRQWIANLNVVGGPHKLLAPIVKWSNQASHISTIYEMTVRAGEMAQRTPSGPVYLNVPIEVMMQEWTPSPRMRQVPGPVPPQAPAGEIERVAEKLLAAKLPVITTEGGGRDAESYRLLGELAELLAIPVLESWPADASNFPKNNPLHQGFDFAPFMDTADLVLMIRSRVPWYPPSNRPRNATVVAIDEVPLRANMVYQSTQADIYLEGDVAHTLRTLVDAVRAAKLDPAPAKARRERLTESHRKMREKHRAGIRNGGIDPAVLCETLNEVLPQDAIFVDETITHRADTIKHINHPSPLAFFRTGGGLGQGLGMALGVKLAAPERMVTTVIGDGSFLYNPQAQSLALSMHAKLPILVVIFNNGGYLAMKREHHAYYPDGIAAEKDVSHGFPITDFEYSELAKPFGGYGERVENPAELKAAVARGAAAVKEGRTAILNVMLNR